MSLTSAPSFDRYRIIFRMALGVAILVVVLTALLTLSHLRQLAETRTVVTTQNMARSLEQTIEGIINTIDVVLLSSADEIARQSTTGTANPSATTRFLERQLKRVPDMSFLRATNARGDLIYGPGVVSTPINISDREFFILLRDNPSADNLLIRHLVARTTGQWTWLFVRRINKADGSFNGVVIAGILVDRIEALFSQFKIDSGGSIALRDAEKGVIARYTPAHADIPHGDKRLSRPFAEALKVNPLEGNYVSGATSIDGISRSHAYRQNEKYGFLINVGLAGENALAEWRKQTIVVIALAAAFIALSLLFALITNRAWRRQISDMEKLSVSQRELQEAEQIANLGHFAYDITRDKWSSSMVLDQIFGIDGSYPRDLEHWLGLVCIESRQELRIYLKTIIDRHQPFDHEYRIIRKNDGMLRWLHGKGKLQIDDQGVPIQLIGTVQDITERKHIETALLKSEMSFRNFFEKNSLVMLLADPESGQIISANTAAVEYYGYSREELTRISLSEISVISPDSLSEEGQRLLHEGSNFYLFSQRLASGEIREAEVYLTLIDSSGHAQLFITVIDVTERKQLEEEIRQLAFYDPLTKLANRRLLNDRLGLTIASSKRSGYFCALLFLDQDNFKPLNDAHGHEVGDLLLIEVANRIRKCVREIDTVARFGGDEFVVVINNLGNDIAESKVQAGIVAEKIRGALAEPYILKITSESIDTRIEHRCSCSIGAVVFNGSIGVQGDIVNWADQAMYKAKEAGRNSIRFYDCND